MDTGLAGILPVTHCIFTGEKMIKYKFSSLSNYESKRFQTARKLVDLGQSERKTDLIKLSSLMSSVINTYVGEDYAATFGYVTGANHVLSGHQVIDFESLETEIINDSFNRYSYLYKDQLYLYEDQDRTWREQMHYDMFLRVFKFGYMKGKDDATALMSLN